MKTRIGVIATALMLVGMSASAADRPTTTDRRGSRVMQRVTIGRAGYTFRKVERPAARGQSSADTQRPTTVALDTGKRAKHKVLLGGRAHVGLRPVSR